MEAHVPYRAAIDIEWSVLLELIVEQVPVGVIVLGPDERLLWTNARARTIFGGSPRAVVPHVAEALAGREIRHARVTVERNRRAAVIEVTASALGGRAGGVVVVLAADVTQRARIERAEAEFVENAAHQLRSPIAAIAASAAALNAGARDDPPARDRFLDHITRESARTATLVDALLSLASLQRGDSPPRIEVVPLGPLLRSAAATAPGDACVRIRSRDGIAVVTDGALLAQALDNVVANAAEHARAEVRIDARVHEATVVVDVRDDGPGIPPELHDRVFERFFRGPNSRARGSGLGLAIASAAAEAAQSTLELLPADGAGAAFRFTIPGAQQL